MSKKKKETKTVSVFIHSSHASIIAEGEDAGQVLVNLDDDGNGEVVHDDCDMSAVGTLTDDGERIEIKYSEPEDGGMGNTATQISFDNEEPGIITLFRSGDVSSALVFEEGKRHMCSYRTPELSFEICVKSELVKNNITSEGGELELDYFLEFHGASAEHTVMNITVSPLVL